MIPTTASHHIRNRLILRQLNHGLQQWLGNEIEVADMPFVNTLYASSYSGSSNVPAAWATAQAIVRRHRLVASY
jgi:hypothetical protein